MAVAGNQPDVAACPVAPVEAASSNPGFASDAKRGLVQYTSSARGTQTNLFPTIVKQRAARRGHESDWVRGGASRVRNRGRFASLPYIPAPRRILSSSFASSEIRP
jgi:hypothetical protein